MCADTHKVYRTGIGKFIGDVGEIDRTELAQIHKRNGSTLTGERNGILMSEEVARKKQKVVLRSNLSDFSAW